ncbi:MAG: hypothetical protein ABJF10_22825 [Chthoniobacter sp.]|uniref:hypothetical protein n=1 Tax=Chthoniobacter sp. TaxID=2510640 RepID=UPI0032A9B4EA
MTTHIHTHLWRRFYLAALALVAVLLGSTTPHANAAPEKERFVQLIQAHAAECTWKLQDKLILGQDLASKGLELSVTDVKWDDDRVYFLVTIAVPADMKGILATRQSWVYSGSWGYAREGSAEAPVLKLIEEPGTLSPRSAVPAKSMSSSTPRFPVRPKLPF